MVWSYKKPPKIDGMYLVTIKGQVRQARRYQLSNGDWSWYILPDGGNYWEVTAWMKQPNPFWGD